MKSLSLIAVFSLVFAVVSGENTKCGVNEIWQTCASPCQENCLTRGFMTPCIKSCFAGCVCQQGFTRLGWDTAGGLGNCVASTRCDSMIRQARLGH